MIEHGRRSCARSEARRPCREMSPIRCGKSRFRLSVKDRASIASCISTTQRGRPLPRWSARRDPTTSSMETHRLSPGCLEHQGTSRAPEGFCLTVPFFNTVAECSWRTVDFLSWAQYRQGSAGQLYDRDHRCLRSRPNGRTANSDPLSPADIDLAKIGDLLNCDLAAFLRSIRRVRWWKSPLKRRRGKH